jgi:hypothetical protein
MPDKSTGVILALTIAKAIGSLILYLVVGAIAFSIVIGIVVVLVKWFLYCMAAVGFMMVGWCICFLIKESLK